MKFKQIAAQLGLALASTIVCAGSSVAPYRVLLSGPVESVDRSANTISVLGHRIALKDVSRILPGQKVDVFGGLASNGALKPAIVNNTAKYSASGDRVLMVGAVTALDRTRGMLFVGGTGVDYTSLLANSRFVSPRLGEVLEVAGTQPAGRGMVLASAINRSPQGVNAGGQALGVNAGGQALGVNAGGQALGVNAGGQVLGVNAGGHALGVNAGGQALGVNAGGHALGVNAGGQALGVNAGGHALGVNAGGQALGVNAGGQALGVNAGGQALGVNAGGHALGVNAGGQALGVNAGGQALGVNAGGQAL